MHKQPEVTDATRKRILEAFRELFQDMPVEKITAAMLAQKAGIHRSSFYRYFSDMYQVFEAFQNELLETLKKDAELIQASTPFSFPQYAEKVSELLLPYADQIYRMLNYKGSDFREQFSETVRLNLLKCLNIDPGSKDTEYITHFVISVMLSNFTFWYEHRNAFELKQINEIGQQILLNGISEIIR